MPEQKDAIEDPAKKATDSKLNAMSALTAVDKESPEVVKNLVAFCKLLNHETRFKIVMLLGQEGEKNVTEICNHIGRIQPDISYQLALLKKGELLHLTRKKGRHRYYFLTPRTSQILKRFLVECSKLDPEEIPKPLPDSKTQKPRKWRAPRKKRMPPEKGATPHRKVINRSTPHDVLIAMLGKTLKGEDAKIQRIWQEWETSGHPNMGYIRRQLAGGRAPEDLAQSILTMIKSVS